MKAAGKPVELLVGEGYNHFEMLETLANPYGLLGRAVFKQMGLRKLIAGNDSGGVPEFATRCVSGTLRPRPGFCRG